MENRSDRHARSLGSDEDFESGALLRRACAETIGARECDAPNERPDICLQRPHPPS